MRRKRERNGSESGMVIVEATIVFPVMFFVIFLLIFLGNAYMQRCRIEAIVHEVALDAAAYCASPMLSDLERNGRITAYKDLNIKPYRYFSGSAGEIESWARNRLNERVNGLSTGLFAGMKPEHWECKVKFNNKFIYSTFRVDVKYDITMPIRLFGSSDSLALRVASHTEMPVTDTAEFMRNVNMVEYYLEITGAKQAINKLIGKVTDTVKKWWN